MELKTISPFRNPVTQAPGGSAYNDGLQRINLSSPVSAIAIATDSQVDVADIFVMGEMDSRARRYRVSADSPLYGWFTPEDHKHLIAVPVRTFVNYSNEVDSGINYQQPAQFPELKLAIYDDPCPPSLPIRRAPLVERFSGEGTTTPVAIYVPTSGRRSVGISLRVSDFATATAVAVVFVGIRHVTLSDGSVESHPIVLETLDGASALASGAQISRSFEGANFDVMALTMTPDAGTYTYSVLFDAQD